MFDKETWKRVWREVDVSYSQDKIISQWDMFERMKIKFLGKLFSASSGWPGKVKSLECGCGGATVSVYFLKKGCRVFAFDFVEEALALARRNLQKAGGECKLLFADVKNIPLKDNTFDIVMSFGLIEHFRESGVEAQIREMARLLKPGGLLFLDIYSRKYHFNKNLLCCENIGRVFNALACFAASLTRSFSIRGAFKEAKLQLAPELFENQLPLEYYESAAADAGITRISAHGNRPFPVLYLPHPLEILYIAFMRLCEPLWSKFDNSQSRFSRYWGAGWWLYGYKESGA